MYYAGNAGTDANITLTLFGSLGGATTDSGPRRLESSANDFERGAANSFLLRCDKALGALSRVVVTSDGSGLGPAWHLASVEVTDVGSGKTMVFPCDRWEGLVATWRSMPLTIAGLHCFLPCLAGDL
jgi:hypothetical protein